MLRVVMARDEKLEHLKRVPLFASFGRRELERLGELTDEIDVGLDDELTRQGGSAHEFFVVVSGRVSVLDGSRVIAELGPGDFFGEIALLDDRPRTATVRSDGITALLVLGRREFHSLMDEFPSVRAAVLKALVERVRRADPDAQ